MRWFRSRTQKSPGTYEKNSAYYLNEPEMNVQEIVVESDSLASAIKEKIENGGDFGSLATKYSLRNWSAKNSGVMGFSPISSFGGLKDTLWNSDIGKIIGPLAFNKYYGLFCVLARKNGEPIDIKVVRPQIVKAIENEKGFPFMKERLENLSKLTTIKVDDDLVKNYTMNLPG